MVTGVTRRLRDGGETLASGGPKKEHLFVAADTISIVSAMIGKEQRPVMSNKDHGATIHTYNVMAEGSPGPSLHHCQCHYSGPPPSTAG